jgi:hypothetical protein
MCYERLWRHREEAQESQELWRDFERTRPVRHDEPPQEVPEPDREEAQEPVVSS